MCQKLFSTASTVVLAVLFFSILGVAQTPSNVEQATRFRAVTNTAELTTTSPSEVSVNKVSNVTVMENKSSAQLEAMGARYAWATSNSQLNHSEPVMHGQLQIHN